MYGSKVFSVFFGVVSGQAEDFILSSKESEKKKTNEGINNSLELV